MREQIFLLGNVIIMLAYLAIMIAIVVPVARAGQLRTNKLAVTTALIFFSCAVGHAFHAWTVYTSIVGGFASHAGATWSSAVWDLFTAAVGVYYWSLRRNYGILLGEGPIYVDPFGQQRLDEAGARERAALANLAALVEHSADAIIATQPDGTITAWNRAAERMFGYPAAEAIGRPASILADEEGALEQAEILRRILSGEPGISYEAHRRNKDGAPLEVSLTASPIVDATGTIIGISVVARDVSAAKDAAERQRAMEERTHQAQRMESLGKLAGGVAHDFNNILSIIVNYTDFAAEQCGDLPEARADLAQVRLASDRAINLTGQLLTFTRGDTIQPRDLDLNGAIAEVQAMLARTIGEHISLLTVPAAQPVVVHADPGQIQQVLLNLAINGRDAMPDGGTLVIEAATASLDGSEINVEPPLPPGTYAQLLVSDTGHGIPADVATHIFEPFYTTKPRGKGTGLGLSTVYGIVVEAGGGITVYSESATGTTFRIYLPLAHAPADFPGVLAEPVEPPDGDGRTVLVVEDEPALARVAARILTNGGYQVLVATGGPEALAQHSEHGCDLVLTDVIMPDMSGRRLAELLHERIPGLPIVYMSGYSNGLLGTTQVLDPDVAFIEKPFTAHDLLQKVGDTLRAAAPHESVT
jgi:two-component system cell cycle sensor histidine kinase/response regulator CckA